MHRLKRLFGQDSVPLHLRWPEPIVRVLDVLYPVAFVAPAWLFVHLYLALLSHVGLWLFPALVTLAILWPSYSVFASDSPFFGDIVGIWWGMVAAYAQFYEVLSSHHGFLIAHGVSRDQWVYLLESVRTAVGQSMPGVTPASQIAQWATTVQSLTGTAFVVIVLARVISGWRPRPSLRELRKDIAAQKLWDAADAGRGASTSD